MPMEIGTLVPYPLPFPLTSLILSLLSPSPTTPTSLIHPFGFLLPMAFHLKFCLPPCPRPLLPPSNPSWKWLWKLPTLPCITTFLWLACHGSLPTKTLLLQRKILIDSTCPFNVGTHLNQFFTYCVTALQSAPYGPLLALSTYSMTSIPPQLLTG